METGGTGVEGPRVEEKRKVCFTLEIGVRTIGCVGSEADSCTQETKRGTKYMKQTAQKGKCCKAKL